MNAKRSVVPIFSLLAIAALLAIGLGGEAPTTEANAPLQTVAPHPVFRQQWEYSDKPVQEGSAKRSWIWGPPGEITHVEYEGKPGIRGISADDELLVQYFDKARMEYGLLYGDSPTVTNGRLVVEMMLGLIEVGQGKNLTTIPSGKPIAGDTQSGARHKNTPTYATLYSVANEGIGGSGSYISGKMVVGTPFTNSLDRFGNVSQVPDIVVQGTSLRKRARAATYKDYDCYIPKKGKVKCGQNIPDVFLNFLNQEGQVYKDGRYQQGKVFDDWLGAVGLPITEPYWVQINIDGNEQWVLFQAFERRVLTYNPANLPPWNVEMGNVGQHYKDWRNTKPDPNGVLVIQATSGSTTEVCSKYLVSNSAKCDGHSYEPDPSITTLQPGSWASTKEKGRMVLESTSTIFQLRQLAKLSFKVISNDLTGSVVTQESGRGDYIHDSTKPPLVVEIGHWKVESVHSLFSVVVTNTVEEEPSFLVAVPSFGGSVRVLLESPDLDDVRQDITVMSGSQLTILEGKPSPIEKISPQEEQDWATLRNILGNVPSLRGITEKNPDAFP